MAADGRVEPRPVNAQTRGSAGARARYARGESALLSAINQIDAAAICTPNSRRYSFA